MNYRGTRFWPIPISKNVKTSRRFCFSCWIFAASAGEMFGPKGSLCAFPVGQGTGCNWTTVVFFRQRAFLNGYRSCSILKQVSQLSISSFITLTHASIFSSGTGRLPKKDYEMENLIAFDVLCLHEVFGSKTTKTFPDQHRLCMFLLIRRWINKTCAWYCIIA